MALLRKIGQTYRCARHVPLPQLLRRFSLNFGRQVMQRIGSKRTRQSQPLTLRDSLPERQFPVDSGLAAQHSTHWWSRQLNCLIRLAPPIRWQEPEVLPLSVDLNPDESRRRVATHLERLTLHYHEFLESLPEETAQEVILDWIRENPPYQRGYWLDNWNSYGISIRCVEWLQWLANNARFHRLPNEFITTVNGSICEQVRFLTQNLETDICGNHLIKNIRCLLWVAACFDHPEAEGWQTLALRWLDHELDRQFLADGMHYELSPAYHCQVLGDLIDCVSVLEGDHREQLIERLRPIKSAMDTLTHPDGLISLFSDGGLHMVFSPAVLSETWKKLVTSSGNGRTSEAAGDSLNAAGYFRFANDTQWLLVDCGPVCEASLPAHGHGDMLAFEWDVLGERIVVDNGVYQYQGVDREFDRSAQSHNTFVMDSQDQAEFIGSFRTGERSQATLQELHSTAEEFRLDGLHSAYQCDNEPLTHRRRFEASGATLKIIDEVAPTNQTELPAARSSTQITGRSQFLLHDLCEAEDISATEVLLTRGAIRVRFTADTPLRIEEAYWSPNFGERIPTKRIVADLPQIPLTVQFNLQVEK